MKKTFLPFTSNIYKKIVLPLKESLHEEHFSGIYIEESILGKSWTNKVKGKPYGLYRGIFKNYSHISMSHFGEPNGYEISYRKNTTVFSVYDMGVELECIVYEQNKTPRISGESIGLNRDYLDINKVISENPNIVNRVIEVSKVDGWSDVIDTVSLGYEYGRKRDLARIVTWAYERKQRVEAEFYKGEHDIVPYYLLQKEQKKQIQQEDNLPDTINYVAGVEIAFDELSLKMVGVIVVYDVNTLEVVDKAYQETEITFPYLPKFYSFREVPPLINAYRKLSIKPNLIICNGHGINHPMGVGVASHLGLELDVSTIAWAKDRLVGDFGAIEYKRGNNTPLLFGEKEVGKVLCIQDNEPPIFVSVGHKVSIETACDWVLKLSSKYSIPEVNLKVSTLTETILEQRTIINFPDDFL